MSEASIGSAATSSPVSVKSLRWLLGGYLFVIFAFFGPGATWSPVSRFCLTRAIVERGTFEITEFAPSTGDRAQRGDRFYTDKAPLPSLMAVPAYAAFHALARLRGRLPAYQAEGTLDQPAQRVVVSPAFRAGLWVASASTAALSAALLGVAMLELLRRRFALYTATVATLATLLGTPLLPYAASFFGHTIAAAFLFGAFVLLDPLAPPETPRRGNWRAIGAGFLLGGAVGSEYASAVPAFALLVYFIALAPRDARWQRLLLLGAGAALPLFVVGGYHAACFGAPWRTGYSFIARPSFAEGHARGLLGVTFPRPSAVWGTLFGSARGVFYIAPISAVALAALSIAWWRTKDPERSVALFCVVSMLAVNASYYMWWGGWATGPRHAVAGFGFLALGVAAAFEWKGAWRAVAVGAALVSVIVMLFTTAVGLEAPPERDAIFEYLLPALHEGRIARLPGAGNLGMVFGLPRRLSVLPLIFWTGLGAYFLLERAVPSAVAREGKR
jgi:hypothetical protein